MRALVALAAVLVAVLCAAVVALAVFILRALDRRGVDLAGAILDAMGAPRVARAATVSRSSARAPARPPAPTNRRRVRALDAPPLRPAWSSDGACCADG